MMIIGKELDVRKVKHISEVAEGDLLRRVSDQVYYELLNVSNGDTEATNIYMFEGFCILGEKNLRKNFFRDDLNNKIQVFN